jgi:hypothetical protein
MNRGSGTSATAARSSFRRVLATNPRSAKRDAQYVGGCRLMCAVPVWPGPAAVKTTVSLKRVSPSTRAGAVFGRRCSATSTQRQTSKRPTSGTPRSRFARTTGTAVRARRIAARVPSTPRTRTPRSESFASISPLPHPTSTAVEGERSRTSASARRSYIADWTSVRSGVIGPVVDPSPCGEKREPAEQQLPPLRPSRADPIQEMPDRTAQRERHDERVSLRRADVVIVREHTAAATPRSPRPRRTRADARRAPSPPRRRR